MAEYKQNITQIQENGNVMISEDVIATIVEQTLSEVEGVSGLATKHGADIADLICKKSWANGMKIQIAEDNTLTIACNVMVAYGHSVVDVASVAQTSVTAAVESMAGVKVNAVHINVCGIERK